MITGTYGRFSWVITRISADDPLADAPLSGVLDVDREGVHVARMGVTWLRLYGSHGNDLVSATNRVHLSWTPSERSELLDCLAYVRALVIRQRERAGGGNHAGDQ